MLVKFKTAVASGGIFRGQQHWMKRLKNACVSKKFSKSSSKHKVSKIVFK